MTEPRPLCFKCLRPKVTCYCHLVQPFVSKDLFVILIHPHEVRVRVNSGRMAHLILQNSQLITGICFDENPRIKHIIAEAQGRAFLIYPGQTAEVLTQEDGTAAPRVFFLLDATWELAQKMYHTSKILHTLPKIMLAGTGLSEFHVKKQPRQGYLATIEAIHRVLCLTTPKEASAPYDNLLEVFRFMVTKQQHYAEQGAVRWIRRKPSAARH